MHDACPTDALGACAGSPACSHWVSHLRCCLAAVLSAWPRPRSTWTQSLTGASPELPHAARTAQQHTDPEPAGAGPEPPHNTFAQTLHYLPYTMYLTSLAQRAQVHRLAGGRLPPHAAVRRHLRLPRRRAQPDRQAAPALRVRADVHDHRAGARPHPRVVHACLERLRARAEIARQRSAPRALAPLLQCAQQPPRPAAAARAARGTRRAQPRSGRRPRARDAAPPAARARRAAWAPPAAGVCWT